jgi:hypothetical protein
MGLFDMFKSGNAEVKEPQYSPEELKYREELLIAEIHNEFDTAQDRLLQEAETVIAAARPKKNAKVIEDKADRLRKLGFIRTQDVEHHNKVLDGRIKVEVTKDFADRIKHYQFRYPFQKFLTEDELNRICEKYKLIYAPVNAYIKTVPNKNLLDIENARPLDEEDSYTTLYTYKNTYASCQPVFDKFVARYGDTFTLADIIRISTEVGLSKHIIKAFGEYKKLEDFTYHVTTNDKEYYLDHAFGTLQIVDKTGLFIAAPPSHFDEEVLKSYNRNEHGFHHVIEIKDPIVFRYCTGGLQVLTMWGDENFDPNHEPTLINPINN